MSLLQVANYSQGRSNACATWSAAVSRMKKANPLRELPSWGARNWSSPTRLASFLFAERGVQRSPCK